MHGLNIDTFFIELGSVYVPPWACHDFGVHFNHIWTPRSIICMIKRKLKKSWKNIRTCENQKFPDLVINCWYTAVSSRLSLWRLQSEVKVGNLDFGRKTLLSPKMSRATRDPFLFHIHLNRDKPDNIDTLQGWSLKTCSQNPDSGWGINRSLWTVQQLRKRWHNWLTKLWIRN